MKNMNVYHLCVRTRGDDDGMIFFSKTKKKKQIQNGKYVALAGRVKRNERCEKERNRQTHSYNRTKSFAKFYEKYSAFVSPSIFILQSTNICKNAG